MSEQEKTREPGLGPIVTTATFSRLILDIAKRFAYPFAPALSRGLNVHLTAITSMIALNQATSVLAVFFGPMIDRVGYKSMMLASMTLFTIGIFLGGLVPFYAVVLISLFLSGFAKGIFDPAIQAYVGERVRFERRGLVIGIMEVAWAGSTLIGIPVIGLLIGRWGWRSSFFFLGSAGLLCLVALGAVFRRRGDVSAGPAKRPARGFLPTLKGMLKQRHAAGPLGFALLTSLANDNLFVVYGVWLEKSFGLSIAGIGLVTGVIGAAELAGEGLTATVADRFGLKRSIIVGAALTSLCYLVVPMMDQSVFQALCGLFLLFLTFEFSIVTFMSLCTELVPEGRASMISSCFAAAGIGRVLGALIGGPIWLLGGMVLTGAVSAIVSGAALLSLVWGLRRWNRAGKNERSPESAE